MHVESIPAAARATVSVPGRVIRIAVRAGAVLALAATLAACDKCGNASPIYTPWHQGACHGETVK